MPLIVVLVLIAVVMALPIVLLDRYTNRTESGGSRFLGPFLDGFHAAGKKPKQGHPDD